MNVRKKDNRVEVFEGEKIERSIKNSAKDINFELTASDVKLISNEVLKILNLIHRNNGTTNSYEVIGIIIEVLKQNKFDLIIPSYLNLI